MSTRSAIAKLNKDGSVDAVYCHSDGYPSHNGKILLENYTNAKKVQRLLALGDLFYLGRTSNKNPNKKRNSFGDYEPANYNYTFAYHRDRGEELNLTHLDSLDEFFEYVTTSWWMEYFYIYDATPMGRNRPKWLMAERQNGRYLLTPLTKKMCAEG